MFAPQDMLIEAVIVIVVCLVVFLFAATVAMLAGERLEARRARAVRARQRQTVWRAYEAAVSPARDEGPASFSPRAARAPRARRARIGDLRLPVRSAAPRTHA